jgi:hypothetical protein
MTITLRNYQGTLVERTRATGGNIHQSLGGDFSVNPRRDSAGTDQSANMRKHESSALGFFVFDMNKPIDLTGQKFGNLLVLSYSHTVKKNGRYWRCLCDCGTETVVCASLLNRGSTRSCGCLARRLASERMGAVIDARRLPFENTKRLAQLYQAVKGRCSNPSDKAYQYYGGRGIVMCQEWIDDRHAFYRWCSENGYAPGLWIERKNVNGDYSPENCTFATMMEQMNNKRNSRFIEWNGERMTATQWERKLGFPRSLLHGRIFARGWSIDRAMTEPCNSSKGAEL